ncbi:MAG: phospholipid carrier-dependent glycosyltransferase [Actinomycetales bacterium]|nr:phospholipid carrier-dependent glycosyltransferase [Actinomycetales bacterium]
MSQFELTGSRLDDWWQRVSTDPRAARAWRWGPPALVLGVAAATRLIGLDQPHDLVFDETYYVKDSWTLLHLGYEGRWGPDPDPAFASGIVDTYDADPAFVAHPPLGKWVIALGLAAFGAVDPTGWRIAVALCGLLLVAGTMLLAHLLFRSTVLTTLAGFLLAIDGAGIVMSRVALLDGVLALFVLAGVIAIVLDRRQAARRLGDWVARRREAGRPTDWGPVLWARPWLVAAGLAFGAASAVKWSGLYVLAAFGVVAVLSELSLRRRAGIHFWVSGTVLRQAPASFLLLVPIAAAVHLASWTGWFVTDGGYARHWVEEGGTAWSGPLAWVPTAFQNWWHYQSLMYGYHVNEHDPHPYQANPLGWLLMLRPTSMYYADHGDGTASAILDIGNPLIWWAGAAALVAVAVVAVRKLLRREPAWAEGVILAGVAAGWLPWMLYLGRTVFWFYTIVFEPYLLLAIVAVAGYLLGRASDPERRRRAGIITVGVVAGLALLLSLFFLPLWVGLDAPLWFQRLHYWFPSWI